MRQRSGDGGDSAETFELNDFYLGDERMLATCAVKGLGGERL